VDKSYRRLTVSWARLEGYARNSGRFAGERALGQSAMPASKLPLSGGGLLTARTKLPALAAGAYRIRLDGEDAGGQSGRIDERSYWFDGKTFEEL
jgi:hypothetical protein